MLSPLSPAPFSKHRTAPQPLLDAGLFALGNFRCSTGVTAHTGGFEAVAQTYGLLLSVEKSKSLSCAIVLPSQASGNRDSGISICTSCGSFGSKIAPSTAKPERLPLPLPRRREQTSGWACERANVIARARVVERVIGADLRYDAADAIRLRPAFSFLTKSIHKNDSVEPTSIHAAAMQPHVLPRG